MESNEIIELVERAAAGDGLAWARIVDEHADLLRSIVRGFRLGEAESLDALQTTWLRLLENLHTIRDASCLRAWLCTTARRVCLETIRARTRTTRVVAAAGRLEHGAPARFNEMPDRDEEGPEANAVMADQYRLLQEAVATLSPRDQALVRMLTEQEAPNYRDISARLGLPVGSIGPTRGRILQRLRGALAEAGVHDAAIA